MQAREFEATALHYTIRVPDDVPEGVSMRVLLLWEPFQKPAGDLKNLFTRVVEGLSYKDLERPRDMGREEPSWDS